MGIFTAIASLASTLIPAFSGSSESDRQAQAFYVRQTQLLGQQHEYYKNLVAKKNIYAVTNTFLVPLIVFLILIYLIYKKIF